MVDGEADARNVCVDDDKTMQQSMSLSLVKTDSSWTQGSFENSLCWSLQLPEECMEAAQARALYSHLCTSPKENDDSSLFHFWLLGNDDSY